VKILSGLLTALMGKQVSEQSVSHYCQQAKNNGYIKLTAKANQASGKAAQYRCDLTRFTDAGVELDPSLTTNQSAASNFSQGIHGSKGIHEAGHYRGGLCVTAEIGGLNNGR
jgi:hypothetical protein